MIKLLSKTKDIINQKIKKFTTKNLILKLEKQGLNYKELKEVSFNDLLSDEVDILKHDSIKISISISVVILFCLIVGI